ncbi:MAG: helix-turn-helix domain-containing protein [Candidatus Accumulibacter sp.]|jgi:transcriptional regulator with XRE-family HTH domain|nr:helix-turn-helix domain-containing protein [Accumulibacter sp.]
MAKRSKLSGVTSLASFGQAVRVSRMDKGISQEELAGLAEIDRSYMGGIERGEHNLSLFNIHRIAAALDVSIADLMRRAGL